MSLLISSYRGNQRGLRGRRGVSIIEVLIGMLVMVLACLGGFNAFAIGLGNIREEGNRRAALEKARQRLEQVMHAQITQIAPPEGAPYWLTCSVDPCGWDAPSGVPITEGVWLGDDWPNQPMETTVEWFDDPTTSNDTARDTLVVSVKVWYTPDVITDTNRTRVLVRSLRTP